MRKQFNLRSLLSVRRSYWAGCDRRVSGQSLSVIIVILFSPVEKGIGSSHAQKSKQR